jgi:hypothetical protein
MAMASRPTRTEPVLVQIYLWKYKWTGKDRIVPMSECQPKAFMLKNYVGKRLFPRLQQSQYGHEFIIITISILFGLVIGGILAGVMVLRGTVGK